MFGRNSQGTRRFERRNRHPIILCVDDEPEILSALQRSLSTEPFEVLTAQGAAEALGWLMEVAVDVVLVDQRMPGTAGTELLQEVRKRSPKTGLAILTAFPEPGMDAGVDALLYKPWNDQSLRETIHRILAQPR